MGWVWCKYCKRSCHEVASEFFATNAPDPPYCTQYSCFVAFRSVWVHLGPFRCFMMLGSKQAELLQLMQNSCHKVALEFFATNPPDPHHRTPNSCFGVFLSVWVHLGPFRYCIKLGAKRAECGAIIAKVRATKSHRNFSQQMHPIHPIGPNTHAFLRFVVFGCIWDHSVALWYSVQNGLNCCN